MVQSYGLDRCLVYDYLLFQHYVFNLAHRYAGASEQVVLEQMSKMLPYIKTPYVVKNVINRYADVLALRSMHRMREMCSILISGRRDVLPANKV